MVSRRSLLSYLGLGGAGAIAGAFGKAAAQQQPSLPCMSMPGDAPLAGDAPPAKAGPAGGDQVPVRTPNGRTLPWKIVGGAKEFHLVAEELEHEFAPGCKAKCWGYNGSTPGPTIEAVEGDRVRILVTNHLKEWTSVHWHGVILPNGMDGVGGLNQPHIKPGETYAYEFTLRQAGTHMYHPHADEMVQMAFGMMGFFIIHPRAGYDEPADRDFAIMLHNWALHPGTYRPDPAVMQDFDLWTFNSKVYPATAPIVVRQGDRVRLRIGNLSMWNHPIHLHGHRFWITGSDGDRWPKSAWRPEVTEIIGVGQVRDFEFVADNPGDWAFHCHMSHHTMNAMGHAIPNPTGVDQSGVEKQIRSMLPGYMAMGKGGMAEHGEHVAMGLKGPENTLPMMTGTGSFGSIEMGGMFSVLKVREGLAAGDYRDPGWYRHPEGTVARRVAFDPAYAVPDSGMGGMQHHGGHQMKDMPGMDMKGMDMGG
ncbi:MAG: copper oxidase [Nevskia sp.]|nr:copper oxidase [Nevskia sp.]